MTACARHVVRLTLLFGLLLSAAANGQAATAEGNSDGLVAQAPASGGQVEMTLAQAVAAALRDNPSLVNSRLGRVLDQYDLYDAEQWFVPQFSFGRLNAEKRHNAGTGYRSWDFAAGPSLDLRLPTGGSVSLIPGWSATVDQVGNTWSEGAGVNITLRQPLLRGGGLGPGRAPLRLARLSEEDNVLRFKAAVMDVVTAVIRAYRAVIEAELAVDINERSLERARETLEVNQLLIETGRMAKQDITQAEANMADRELGLVESQIRLDDARRDLNILLDLDGAVRVVPTEPMTVAPKPVDLARSRELARLHHTGYLQAALNLRRNEINLMLARNQSLWDLSLNANANFSGSGDGGGESFNDLLRRTDEGDYRVALSLDIPLSGTESRRIRRQRLAAELAMRQAENSMASATREMDIAVRNAVRAVDTGIRRLQLAEAALKLAEEKLEVERGKLQLGLSSNFLLTQYQTDLVDAQVAELSAKIGYMNAVSGHDRTLGTVLGTWDIEIDEQPASGANGQSAAGSASAK